MPAVIGAILVLLPQSVLIAAESSLKRSAKGGTELPDMCWA